MIFVDYMLVTLVVIYPHATVWHDYGISKAPYKFDPFL